MSALVGVIMGSKSDWSTLSPTADMTFSSSTPMKPQAAA